MSLVVFTALVGLLVAPGHVHPVIGFTALLCIAVGAGASGALNMWYDADIDAIMTRTARRPIPAGRMLPGEALAFGATLAVGSVVVLGLLVNVARGRAARLHHLLLRVRLHDVAEALDAAEHRDRRRGRRVPADDRLGGGDRRHQPRAGADVPDHLPLDAAALLGAVAAQVRTIIARAGMPMLPVVAGLDETRRQILLYTLVLAPVGLTPTAVRLCRASSTARSRSSAARSCCGSRGASFATAPAPAAARAAAKSCSRSRFSMCSCCSPRCCSIIRWRASGCVS